MADIEIDSHIKCPTDQDISNILSRFKSGSKTSPNDQEDLKARCKEWVKKDDNYFLRVRINLFIHVQPS